MSYSCGPRQLRGNNHFVKCIVRLFCTYRQIAEVYGLLATLQTCQTSLSKNIAQNMYVCYALLWIYQPALEHSCDKCVYIQHGKFASLTLEQLVCQWNGRLWFIIPGFIRRNSEKNTLIASSSPTQLWSYMSQQHTYTYMHPTLVATNIHIAYLPSLSWIKVIL